MASLLYIGLIVISAKRAIESRVFQAFILFLIGCLVWTITLYLYFFVNIGDLLLSIGRLNYGASVIMPIGLALFFYYFPKENIKISSLLKKIILGFSGFLFLITLFTPLINQAETMTTNGPEITLGPLHSLFLLYVLSLLLGIVYLGIKKLKISKGIEKKKLLLAFGIFLSSAFGLLILNGFFPAIGIFLFQEYSFLILVPIVVTFYYAVVKYRFLNLRLSFGKLLETVISLSIAFSIAKFFENILQIGGNPNLVLTGRIFFIILIYSHLNKIFELPFLQRIFRTGNTAFFQNELKKFQREKKSYTDPNEFNSDIRNLFEEKLGIKKIGLIKEFELGNFPNLVNHYKNNKEILVTEELRFLKDKGKEISFFDEISGTGEVFIPFYQGGNLIAIGYLGEKKFGDLYTKEEIESLEMVRAYLNLTVSNLLYSSNLQKEVDKKTKELQEIIEQQNDFILTASHELRTPITSITGTLEALAEEIGNDELKTILHHTSKSAEKMQKLIKTLFEVQSLEKGIELEKKEINLKEFLEEIYREHKSLIEEKELKFKKDFKIGENEFLKLDEIRFKQILSNLLSNALKFTKKGEISLLVEKEGDFYLFKVCDTGEGVPKETKEIIFQKFRGNHTQKGMGIGLGLFICKKLVEMHGGEIGVMDNETLGSCFFVKLKK